MRENFNPTIYNVVGGGINYLRLSQIISHGRVETAALAQPSLVGARNSVGRGKVERGRTLPLRLL